MPVPSHGINEPVVGRDWRALSSSPGCVRLVIEVTRLAYNGKSYDLRTDEYSKAGPSRNVRSAATIGGGAGLGAILGGILGGGKGAAIGAMIGAGVGTGVQAAGRGAVVQVSRRESGSAG